MYNGMYNGNHWQHVRPSTSESSGLHLHFAFFKLIRTLEENILRGLKDWLKKCIFHPKITRYYWKTSMQLHQTQLYPNLST